MIEATLYGLPMATVNVTDSPQTNFTNTAITGDPGADQPSSLGNFLVRQIELSFNHGGPQEASSHGVPIGKFYSLDGEVFVGAGRPIEPMGSVPILPAGDDYELRSILWRGGTFVDFPDFDPVIARPVWDNEEGNFLNDPEADFIAEGWFPTKLWTANRFGNQEMLVIISGQFNNQVDDQTFLVQRLFSNMVVEAIFGPVNSVDFAPPSILYAGAQQSNGGLEFLVSANDEEGVALVLVTYQDSPTSWASVELLENGSNGIWSAIVPGLTEDTPFFVQACDFSGNCSAKMDKNEYLEGAPPPQFVNRVGEPHSFTITVWKDPGTCTEPGLTPDSCLIPAEGEFPVVSMVDALGDPVIPSETTQIDNLCETSGTDEDGKCTVTIVSGQPGPITISANVDLTVNDVFLSRTTDGEIGNSLDATKIYVDTSLALGDAGSTLVNQPYEVTATVMKDSGTGAFEPAVGELVSFTLTPQIGATIVAPTDLTCTTLSDGTCSLSFTSSTAGTISVDASTTVLVQGLDFNLSTSSTDPAGTIDVSFSDFDVQVATDANLEVGNRHVFTVTVTQFDGTTTSNVNGVIPVISTGDLTEISNTCSTGTVNGTCTIEVTSTEPGTYPVTATVDFTPTGGLPIIRTSTATLTYVGARVSVVPSSAENGVDESHIFTVTVETHDGQVAGEDGWEPVVGLVSVQGSTEFSLSFGADTPETEENLCELDPVTGAGGTDENGQCIVRINNSTTGDFTLTVAVNTSVAVGEIPVGVTAQNTGTKGYRAGSLNWSKVDQNNTELTGATFEACRTHDRSGADIPDECEFVSGDSAGVFTMSNMRLGSWTIKEDTAPEGYFPSARVETINLGIDSNGDGILENLDVSITPAFINIAFPGRVLETGTTCETYLDGSALELTEVIYNISRKDQIINNVAPGVFFYYTTFGAPSENGFTIKVQQENVVPDDYPNFTVQNESNIRLFNGDCSMPTVSYSFRFTDGQVWIDFNGPNLPSSGDQFILSVKYETNAVVGLPIPDVQLPPVEYPYASTTVHYSYTTLHEVDPNDPTQNAVLDLDIDGVLLKKKGTK
jgi:hypothetical protein